MEATKGTVLVVDDVPKNLQLVSAILDEYDYDVHIASSGTKALEKLQSADVDLILLDVMMPDIDGYETCRMIKKQKELAHIPVIFLTAKSDVESLMCGFEAGGIDYVTKPFNKLELITRIKTHVEMKKAKDQIETLEGLIPICASCKKIREEEELWENIESYIQKHSEASFTHTICPACSDKLYGEQEWYKKMKAKKTAQN